MTNPDNVGGPLENVIHAGSLLSNVAFNLSQHAAIRDQHGATLKDCQREWDRALREFRQAGERCRAAPAGGDVFEAYKTWPEGIRAKLSMHDLRRMGGWAPRTNVGDWRIDTSAGGPILVYQNCSVIESEQARYVLRLIERDLKDSAPAGSGEVETCAAKLEAIATARYAFPREWRDDIASAAALLRKLQQWADSKPKVGLPFEVLDRLPGQPADEVWLMQGGKPLGKFKVAASQGQEGGSHE